MEDSNRRRRLPKVERRRLIEEAASELFARHGYAATRLEDIAAAAGVTKQLLYQHFSSKKALHMALLAKHRDELLGGLAKDMATPGPLIARLPRVLDRWFGYVEEHPFAAAMLFRDTTGDPEIQAFYRELQASARMANVALIRAEPDLEVAPERIEPLAELIRSATTGLALWWTDHPEVPRATVVDVALDLLVHGLGFVQPRDQVPTGPDTAALQETFSSIYADETWSDKLPGMPRSGRGALPAHARSVIEFITERIRSGDVRSIVDIGCGDLTWVSTIPQVTSGQVRYVGYDVVPELLAEHRALGWGEFRLGDVTAPGFRVHADLVLVKDVLFHLEDEQVERALANLRASEWRWLLTSSSPNASNADRQFDRWHFAPLNLLVAPYDLRPSLHLERPAGGSFVVFEPSDFRPHRPARPPAGS